VAGAAQVGGHRTGLAATLRTDRWWLEPLATGLGFAIFVVYANWAAFQGNHYYVAPYLSPFYSPLLFVEPGVAGGAPVGHALFGAWPGWLAAVWPAWMPRSPAWLILIGPLSFRLTCYYYRKFYYRSYFVTPPACAVGGARTGKYRGETALLLIQNVHRYALYVAIGFIAFLFYDAYHAFFRDGKLGVGVGSIILLLNPILLCGYTFGCHSLRHLVGGQLDCFSCDAASKARKGVWNGVTRLNEHHMLWAWISLCGVGFADVYVRLVSMGVWRDLNTWGAG
jgi:hypothetical protein